MKVIKRPSYQVLQRLHARYMSDSTMTLDHISACLEVAPETVRRWFARHSLPVKQQGKHMKGRPNANRGKRLGPYKRRIPADVQPDAAIIETAA